VFARDVARALAGPPLDEVQITSITNGVHGRRGSPTSSRTARLPATRILRHALELADDVVWRASRGEAADARSSSRARRGAKGWTPTCSRRLARRFATYQRAGLLFQPAERLAKLLGDPERPLQDPRRGKAHPATRAARTRSSSSSTTARRRRAAGRVVFLEDYEMMLASPACAGRRTVLASTARPRAPPSRSIGERRLHLEAQVDSVDPRRHRHGPELYDNKVLVSTVPAAASSTSTSRSRSESSTRWTRRRQDPLVVSTPCRRRRRLVQRRAASGIRRRSTRTRVYLVSRTPALAQLGEESRTLHCRPGATSVHGLARRPRRQHRQAQVVPPGDLARCPRLDLMIRLLYTPVRRLAARDRRREDGQVCSHGTRHRCSGLAGRRS